MSSFSGLAVTLLPWLLAGGTLSLHHAFDPDAFAAQCRDDRCDTVALPGPLVPRLAQGNVEIYYWAGWVTLATTTAISTAASGAGTVGCFPMNHRITT